MHHRQQDPAVRNNIIGCNHIMQWYWQLLPEIYFHESCDGTCRLYIMCDNYPIFICAIILKSESCQYYLTILLCAYTKKTKEIYSEKKRLTTFNQW